jgi:pimeloyl-ACP methyl ester carboxylesterase
VWAASAAVLFLLGCGSEPARPRPQVGRKAVLYAYDRDAGTLRRCAAHSVGAAERPIVIVHGLLGGTKTSRPLLAFLARQPDLQDRPLLVFAYPSSGGLARAAQGLGEELQRVVASAERTTFLCHSAGGLVFRHYAEALDGPFDRAVLLGTPHRGSSLADLGSVRAASGLAAVVRRLLPEKAAARLPGVLDRMLPEVRPGSPFLGRLGPEPPQGGRYQAFGGTWMNRRQSLAVQASFLVARSFLRGQAGRIPSPFLRTATQTWLDGLRLPAELTRGDLLVSADSACLASAGRVACVRASHRALRADPRVLRQVLRALADDPPR